jgi:hypothetical protein
MHYYAQTFDSFSRKDVLLFIVCAITALENKNPVRGGRLMFKKTTLNGNGNIASEMQANGNNTIVIVLMPSKFLIVTANTIEMANSSLVFNPHNSKTD